MDSLDAQPVEHAGPAAPRRHLGLGASASLFVQVAPIVGVTVVSVVVARRLGPNATVAIGLMTALLEVLLAVFGFGLTTGITYFASRGDWSVRDAFRESQLAAALLGVLGVVVGLVFFVITRDEVFAGLSLLSAVLGIGHLPFKLARGFTGAMKRHS